MNKPSYHRWYRYIGLASTMRMRLAGFYWPIISYTGLQLFVCSFPLTVIYTTKIISVALALALNCGLYVLIEPRVYFVLLHSIAIVLYAYISVGLETKIRHCRSFRTSTLCMFCERTRHQRGTFHTIFLGCCCCCFLANKR